MLTINGTPKESLTEVRECIKDILTSETTSDVKLKALSVLKGVGSTVITNCHFTENVEAKSKKKVK